MSIRVNGKVITEEAIQYELGRLIRFYSAHMAEGKVREQMDVLKSRAREQAIGALLLIEEAQKLDIQVPDDDVDASVRRMAEQAGGKEKFEQMIAEQGISLNEIRETVRRGRRVDLLIERITAEAPEPTEAEIKAHYEAHEQEYTDQDKVQAQHVLIRPGSDKHEDRQTARSRLQEIREKIEAGADFADMAAAHSDCPSGAKAGGSLGWITRGTTVPELDDVLFTIDDGQLSDVVETPLGFHILRRTAHEKGELSPYEDVRDSIRDFLRHVSRGEVISGRVNDLKSKAMIEED